MNPTEGYEWAICDEDGVVDRFANEADALTELAEYEPNCYVALVPVP